MFSSFSVHYPSITEYKFGRPATDAYHLYETPVTCRRFVSPNKKIIKLVFFSSLILRRPFFPFLAFPSHYQSFGEWAEGRAHGRTDAQTEGTRFYILGFMNKKITEWMDLLMHKWILKWILSQMKEWMYE